MAEEVSIGIQYPPILLPCGHSFKLPGDLLAVLGSLGTHTLRIDSCYFCQEAHTVELPDCGYLTAQIYPAARLAVPRAEW